MELPGSTRRLALACCSCRYLVRLAAVQPFRRSSALGSTRGPLTPPPPRGIGSLGLLGESAAAGHATALALDGHRHPSVEKRVSTVGGAAQTVGEDFLVL